MDKQELQKLQDVCKKIRREVVEMIYTAKSGHPGGNLSAVEIITTLFKKCMKQYPDWDKNPNFKNRDRFVLSKGHASATLYAVMADCGYFPESELNSFRKLGSKLQGHPSCKLLKGIEVSTGSLGQGLSIANGMAMASKLDGEGVRVYCICGDGEIEEGQIWEAAMTSAHYKLDNLCLIIDNNNLQIDGKVDEVMNVYPIDKKLKSFGFETINVDGHNIADLITAFEQAKETKGKPTAIIANTVKGEGISFMEDQIDWHGKAPNEEQYEEAKKELGGAV